MICSKCNTEQVLEVQDNLKYRYLQIHRLICKCSCEVQLKSILDPFKFQSRSTVSLKYDNEAVVPFCCSSLISPALDAALL